MLVSLQSHAEVLNTLDGSPEIRDGGSKDGKIFIASVSPQVRASLAATYGISEREAGYMVDQFLSGPNGLRAGGNYNSGFTWTVDTNVMRQVVLELSTAEVSESLENSTARSDPDPNHEFPIPKRPILSSACPGWICYAEKTHPHVLPHLSRLKSPQALTGTFLKTILSKKLNISPSRIWHLAIMPCFDKKLEASRQELTDVSWQTASPNTDINTPDTTAIDESPTRDVDCVITSRELLMLASSRNISLPNLPLKPLDSQSSPSFPDNNLSSFLFPRNSSTWQSAASGPSGGYLHHLMTTYQSQNPNSTIETQRGRNADVVEYTLLSATGDPIIKTARYYGFRNIQNLVRKLKPARSTKLPGARPASARMNPSRRGGAKNSLASGKVPAPTDFAYIEVMACPGGCTNGGGQIRLEDAAEVNPSSLSTISSSAMVPNGTASNPQQPMKATPSEQRAWLSRVDEAYYSAGSEDEGLVASRSSLEGPPSSEQINSVLKYWSDSTDIPLPKLLYTTFRKVESDVGKNSAGGVSDTTRVAELAGKAGGGW